MIEMHEGRHREAIQAFQGALEFNPENLEVQLDLYYIQHQSLLLDLKILIRTIPAVLSRKGAY